MFARARCCCVTRGRLTEERALSSRQLMLVHSKILRWLARPLLPKGWTAGGFKTSGDLEAQRVSLQTLGNRLAGLGIFSFLCKCVSSATSYFARDVFAPASGNFEAIMFLATTLTVQAIPSALTLLLLNQFHFNGGGESRGTLMQSLLTREEVSFALSSDSAAAAASSQQVQHAPAVARLQEEIAKKASENARLQEENVQKASDIIRLQEENARLRAQLAASRQAK